MRKIKVIHLTTTDMYGAGRAAVRISNALAGSGEVISKVLTAYSNKSHNALLLNVSKVDRGIREVFNFCNHSVLNSYNKDLFSGEQISIDYLKKNKEVQVADVINLHWINNGIYSHSFIRQLITLKKPVIWTLHDMFPITGGCHYSGDCDKFKKCCGMCDVLNSTKKKDLSYKEFLYKKRMFSNIGISFVGCSEWITDVARTSGILSGGSSECVCIPNPVDKNFFYQGDKKLTRKMLGIQTDKKIILFCAGNVNDKRKGLRYFKEALNLLDSSRYFICTFGELHNNIDIEKFEHKHFGYIYSDFQMNFIYNAADVLVTPSIQENLSNTVMESLSAGTPVVAFQTGGMKDMIIDSKNGYLVDLFDTTTLAKKIDDATLLVDHKKISEDVYSRFSEEKIARSYLALYQNCIKR